MAQIPLGEATFGSLLCARHGLGMESVQKSLDTMRLTSPDYPKEAALSSKRQCLTLQHGARFDPVGDLSICTSHGDSVKLVR